MRFALTLIALAASSMALAADPPPHSGAAPVVNLPAYHEPARPWDDVEDAARRQTCLDRIEQVRAADGRPRRDRRPATESEAQLHYAVDHKVDGCNVLVPVADPGDLKPVPEPGKPALKPARPEG